MQRAALLAALALATAACTPRESAPPSPAPSAAIASPAATGSPEPSAGASSADPTPSPPARPTLAPAWAAVPDAPLGLTEVAAAAHGGRIWVAGGLRGDGTPATAVLVFAPGDGSWTRGPDLPAAVHHAALVSTGEDLYLVGGLRGAFPGRPTAVVLRLAADGTAWERAPDLPQARGAGAAAWDGARLVYGGGLGADGPAADVWALEGGAWRRVGALSTPREHLAAASDGAGTTWFLGGRRVRLATNTGRVEILRGDTLTVAPAGVTARSGGAGFHHPAVGACLAGGEGPAGTHGEVECVGPDGVVVALPGLAVPRHGLGAGAIGDAAWLLLGGRRPGLFVSAVGERLDLGAP